MGLNVPVGDQRFGRLVRCNCAVARREVQEIAARQARRWGMKPNEGQIFDDFVTRGRDASVRNALKIARRFAETPQRCVMLWGGYGTGKTHLVMAVANELLERGVGVLAFTAPDLLDMLREGYEDGSYARLLGAAKSAEVLLLDDLGSERGTAWADEKLFQVVDARYREQRPLLISSNVDPERFENGRLADRLCDQRWCLRVHLVGASFRRSR